MRHLRQTNGRLMDVWLLGDALPSHFQSQNICSSRNWYQSINNLWGGNVWLACAQEIIGTLPKELLAYVSVSRDLAEARLRTSRNQKSIFYSAKSIINNKSHKQPSPMNDNHFIFRYVCCHNTQNIVQHKMRMIVYKSIIIESCNRLHLTSVMGFWITRLRSRLQDQQDTWILSIQCIYYMIGANKPYNNSVNTCSFDRFVS